jgi:hypothetical protein
MTVLRLMLTVAVGALMSSGSVLAQRRARLLEFPMQRSRRSSRNELIAPVRALALS